jgi:hypothetical protein
MSKEKASGALNIFAPLFFSWREIFLVGVVA